MEEIINKRDKWRTARRIPHNAELYLRAAAKSNRAHTFVYRMSRQMYNMLSYVKKGKRLNVGQVIDYINQTFGLNREVTSIVIYE